MVDSNKLKKKKEKKREKQADEYESFTYLGVTHHKYGRNSSHVWQEPKSKQVHLNQEGAVCNAHTNLSEGLRTHTLSHLSQHCHVYRVLVTVLVIGKRRVDKSIKAERTTMNSNFPKHSWMDKRPVSANAFLFLFSPLSLAILLYTVRPLCLSTKDKFLIHPWTSITAIRSSPLGGIGLLQGPHWGWSCKLL